MQELEINVPKKVSATALRADLENIILRQGGKTIDVRKFPIPEKLNTYLQELTEAQGRSREDIISITNFSSFTNRKVYPLYYGVGQLRFYSKAPGLIVTLSNDLNCFAERTLIRDDLFFYYSAKIIFDGFDEYSLSFRSLKQNIISYFK